MGILRQFSKLCVGLIAPMMIAQMPSIHSSQGEAIQREAWQIVQLANQSRAAAGAGPLRWDPALAVAAQQHCLRMAAEGPIAHRYAGEQDVSGRAGQAGAHFSLIEENVAIAPTPAAIHDAWMHSAGHRANLLNPAVDRVGVAVVAGRNGLYAVADYERSVQPLTQGQQEASVGKLLRSAGVNLVDEPTAARAVCATDRGMQNPGSKPRFIMRWQGADLTRLPRELSNEIASGKYRQAAVGSCTPQDTEGAFTAYRLAVLLY